jgi:hypothetical protein
MKTVLEDFNAIVGREDMFKSMIRNKNLYEISDDNEVKVVNFATSKICHILIYNVPTSQHS